LVIDVREPREYQRGHIPQAKLIPLPGLFVDEVELPDLSTSERSIVVVCRGGRRSTRAAYHLIQRGSPNIRVLQGGMLAWESAGLLEAIESGHQNEGES
jgi:SulP family sulfate permease